MKAEPLTVPQAEHYLDIFIYVSETFPWELVYFEGMHPAFRRYSFRKIGKKFCPFYANGPRKSFHLWLWK